ncbi:hypothetical protein KAT80_02120 [Candidatus Pacearchaeota archaeon]|nr:hypothetical protein [Candidatus Pacearchaeota archaeon]
MADEYFKQRNNSDQEYLLFNPDGSLLPENFFERFPGYKIPGEEGVETKVCNFNGDMFDVIYNRENKNSYVIFYEKLSEKGENLFEKKFGVKLKNLEDVK